MILLFCISSYAVVIDGLVYEIDNKDLTATLTSCEIEGIVNIPESIIYNGVIYNVKYIGKGGSYPQPIFTKATRVEIPASVEVVRGGVFAKCSTINDIIFKDGDENLTIVGKENSYNEGAFFECWGLKYIYVGRPFTKTNLFYNTHIFGPIKVDVGPNVKYISGFKGAPIDPEINLSGIEKIGNEAFMDTKISEVKIPNIRKIGFDAFKNCPVSTLELGNNIQEIGSGAFFNTKITNLTLPASLEKVGKEALFIKSLTNITIEDSPIPLIMDDCNMFTESPYEHVYLGRDIDSKSLNEYCGPFGKDSNVKDEFPPINIRFGEFVTRINDSMFANRSFKDSLVLSDNIANIMIYGFGNYTKGGGKATIKYIKLPKGLKECGNYPFNRRFCNDVEIPEGMTILNGDLIPGKQTKISIPHSIEIIQKYSVFNADSIIFPDRNEVLEMSGVDFNADYIYCGMPLKSYYDSNNLVCNKFVIGSNVSSLFGNVLTCIDQDPIIISKAIAPPDMSVGNTYTYDNAKVIVEYNSVEVYQESPIWRGFTNYDCFITLSCAKIDLYIGQTFDLEGKINELFANDNSLEWSSSNEKIVSVEDGIIQAKSVGAKCKIMATDKYGHIAYCMVNVIPLKVESLSLDPSELTAYVGSISPLSITILPTNATNKSLSWSSSDDEIATVDTEGNVYAHKVGEVVITARTNDGSDISASCKVTVITSPVTSIIIDRSEWIGMAGETISLIASVLPEDATDRSIIWSSSDEEVATVTKEGLVTALNVGEAYIMASAADGSDVSASCKVTIIPTLVNSLYLNRSEWSGRIGDSIQLIASIIPEDATDKTLEWKSSDESIASVTKDGIVTAINVGETIVTAKTTDGSEISASCRIIVRPILVESINLSPDNWSGEEGQVFQLNVSVMPDDATDKTLIYISSDKAVAEVDQTGLVSVINVGTCKIIVSTLDGSNLTAECIITSTAGIGDIFNDDDTTWNVYDTHGLLLKNNCTKADLEKLSPGMYILQSKQSTTKIIIR